MKKNLLIISLILLPFSVFAVSKSKTVKVSQSCTMKVMNTDVSIQILEPQYHVYHAEIFQNNVKSSATQDVAVSIKNLNDLNHLGPSMAIQLLQMTLTQSQIKDISYIVVYDIDGKANHEDASGAMILDVAFKSTQQTVKLGQIGWGYGICQ